MSKKVWWVMAIAGIAFAGMQFIHPPISNPPVTAEIAAPRQIEGIIKRTCYDCHSNETHLRWYDEMEPAYWQVETDVKDGRDALNFSNWGNMTPVEQKAKIWEMVNQIQAGAMPLKSYVLIHRDARISPDDLLALKAYNCSMAVKNIPGDTARINAADLQSQALHNGLTTATVPTAPNGIAYMPDYKNWHPIATTDRFDNGTMRVILGNNIAMTAIHDNNIHPWPNGTIFAKVAWDQIEDTNGMVKTGAFKQVEYMVKDSKKYASTKGWGFARFKTEKLVPYGKTALFATECVNCHSPQQVNDFVFTLPVKH